MVIVTFFFFSFYLYLSFLASIKFFCLVVHPLPLVVVGPLVEEPFLPASLRNENIFYANFFACGLHNGLIPYCIPSHPSHFWHDILFLFFFVLEGGAQV